MAAKKKNKPKALKKYLEPSDVKIRTTQGDFSFGDKKAADPDWHRRLQRAAMEWTYVVRNRQRWRASDQSMASVEERAREILFSLGLKREALETIAICGVAEVAIPFEKEELGWEARIFPWEFVIAGATREYRQGKPLTVSRSLERSGTRPAAKTPVKVLYVECAPGTLRTSYDFSAERELFKTSFPGKSFNHIEPLLSPTLVKLRETVKKEKPDVIHLSGFDSHQGMAELSAAELRKIKLRNKDKEDEPVLDGYLMEGADGEPPEVVGADRLSVALTGDGTHRPMLVAFNIQNSAARTAAMAVAAGVQHTISFQDTFDEALAELFFRSFYRAWRRNRWDTHLAFRGCWEYLRSQSSGLGGTGIALWSDRALVSRKTAGVHPRHEKQPVWLPGSKPSERLDEILKVAVVPYAELNYAQLHNKRPLFDTFTLTNESAIYDKADQLAILADVEIEVKLNAGAEETSYRRQVRVDGPSLDLRRHIHLPLISTLMRTVNEAMNTSLQVEVKWGRTLFRDTFAVRLLPVDQWRDNDKDGQWLPSFVLPRDCAVPGLIEKAQHYVRVVRDDPSSGFDGYQSFDENAEIPWLEIDRQVQAIWSMLVHELKLGYVNPPPTYTNEFDSQRLRTPSLIERHRCGTCIDLALLMAACLEYIDIYPVIFLLKDHAFPGYWRGEDAREKFFEVNLLPADLTTEHHATTEVAGSQSVPWWLRETAYREIVQQVRNGTLVPLETVWLTEHSGFGEAIDGGRDNLKSARRFHSMLDIVKARESQVTPLPIGEMP